MSDNAQLMVTQILRQIATAEDPQVQPAQLLPLVYDQLRGLAGSYLNRENPGHTLQATALVHEAYMKLVDQDQADLQGKTHFFAVSAQAMRRLLVDHARGRNRLKRAGDQQRVTLNPEIQLPAGKDMDMADLIGLDQALTRLAELDPRQAQVVEMRCFGGMNVEEVALALGVSRRTVEGDWTHARAWLKRCLSGE